jgi:predicted dehydrogenase
MPETIRCGVIGYGGAFNMGRAHAEYITQTDGLELTAVCDLDPTRTGAAKEDFAHISTYNDVAQMLAAPDVDLAVIVLPHNLHAPVSIQCSQAGKHVIVEKPMCVTVEEATQMIEASRAAGKMLSVFHNRRQDADYRTLRELVVEKKIIGDVFKIEVWSGGFHKQNPNWWRSSKEISGGYFYDWGAHFLDWLLGLVPGQKIESSRDTSTSACGTKSPTKTTLKPSSNSIRVAWPMCRCHPSRSLASRAGGCWATRAPSSIKAATLK